MSLTRKMMNNLITDTAYEMHRLNRVKGHDYTQGSEDAFANFKECAEEIKDINDPAFQTWAILWLKHKAALWTYLEGKPIKDTSEPPEKRIDDMILYLMLLKGEIMSREGKLVEKVSEDLSEVGGFDSQTDYAEVEGP